MRNAFKTLSGKPERMRPLGETWVCVWDDSVETDVKDSSLAGEYEFF
jgi:hypothetical protein